MWIWSNAQCAWMLYGPSKQLRNLSAHAHSYGFMSRESVSVTDVPRTNRVWHSFDYRGRGKEPMWAVHVMESVPIAYSCF